MEVYLCRHGDTEWSRSGQHTGITDLALCKEGIAQAARLRKRLQKSHWDKIYTSPMKRCLETCEMAQLPTQPLLDPRLKEWNYGSYEGKTSKEIEAQRPGWNLFVDGAPGGESPSDIAHRADEFIADLKKNEGTILVFSHGHFLRALAMRWLNLPIQNGKLFLLSTSSLSILSFEKNQPVLKLWNDVSHLNV